jgi:type 2A phosphatase activator TIP41
VAGQSVGATFKLLKADSTRKHVHSEIKDVIKPFDWSYTTDYKGTVYSNPDASSLPAFAPTEMQLPIHLLKVPDPILFYSSVDLFEDELADNGM